MIRVCYRRGAKLLVEWLLNCKLFDVCGPSCVKVASSESPFVLDGLIKLMTLLGLTEKDNLENTAWCLLLITTE